MNNDTISNQVFPLRVSENVLKDTLKYCGTGLYSFNEVLSDSVEEPIRLPEFQSRRPCRLSSDTADQPTQPEESQARSSSRLSSDTVGRPANSQSKSTNRLVQPAQHNDYLSTRTNRLSSACEGQLAQPEDSLSRSTSRLLTRGRGCAERTSSLPKLIGDKIEKDGEFSRTSSVRLPRGRTNLRIFSPSDLIVGEVLGKGAFGQVSKVTHRETGEVFVLKELWRVEDHAKKRFLKEVALLRNVQHANVLQFCGVVFRDTGLHLIAEFIGGGTLLNVVMESTAETLSYIRRVSFARDIAAGMEYLHGRGIIHRDLNSSNCLVRENDSVVVADFGLARILPEVEKQISRSRGKRGCRKQRYTVVGHPYFMAPEMVNRGKYDEKVDIYSFGIILCEVIGRVEADPDVMPRLNNFTLDVFEFRAKFCHECPDWLCRIAFLCCSRDPDRRPAFTDTLRWLDVLAKDASMGLPPPSSLLHELDRYEQGGAICSPDDSSGSSRADSSSTSSSASPVVSPCYVESGSSGRSSPLTQLVCPRPPFLRTISEAYPAVNETRPAVTVLISEAYPTVNETRSTVTVPCSTVVKFQGYSKVSNGDIVDGQSGGCCEAARIRGNDAVATSETSLPSNSGMQANCQEETNNKADQLSASVRMRPTHDERIAVNLNNVGLLARSDNANSAPQADCTLEAESSLKEYCPQEAHNLKDADHPKGSDYLNAEDYSKDSDHLEDADSFKDSDCRQDTVCLLDSYCALDVRRLQESVSPQDGCLQDCSASSAVLFRTPVPETVCQRTLSSSIGPLDDNESACDTFHSILHTSLPCHSTTQSSLSSHSTTQSTLSSHSTTQSSQPSPSTTHSSIPSHSTAHPSLSSHTSLPSRSTAQSSLSYHSTPHSSLPGRSTSHSSLPSNSLPQSPIPCHSTQSLGRKKKYSDMKLKTRALRAARTLTESNLNALSTILNDSSSILPSHSLALAAPSLNSDRTLSSEAPHYTSSTLRTIHATSTNSRTSHLCQEKMSASHDNLDIT